MSDEHVAQSWQRSPEMYVMLHDAYEKARAEKKDMFFFMGRYVLVSYAKYLLEYLEDELEIRRA